MYFVRNNAIFSIVKLSSIKQVFLCSAKSIPSEDTLMGELNNLKVDLLDNGYKSRLSVNIMQRISIKNNFPQIMKSQRI